MQGREAIVGKIIADAEEKAEKDLPEDKKE